MTTFYIPKPTQYLNLTTTLLINNKQQIRSLRQKCDYRFVFKVPFIQIHNTTLIKSTCVVIHLRERV